MRRLALSVGGFLALSGCGGDDATRSPGTGRGPSIEAGASSESGTGADDASRADQFVSTFDAASVDSEPTDAAIVADVAGWDARVADARATDVRANDASATDARPTDARPDGAGADAGAVLPGGD